MTLPTMNLPIYDLALPSDREKEIKVRPFTVKEEKLLLLAAESKDINDVINTTKQVVQNCILTEGVDVEKMPFFDVDYLFIALRAKSLGATIDIQFKCNNVVDDGGEDTPCNNVFSAKIDIANISTIQDNVIDPLIKLSNKISIKMRYPSYSLMKTLTDKDSDLEKKSRIVVGCIETIYDGKKAHSYRDYSKAELEEFVDRLTEESFKKLEEFVENFPYFAVNAEATCSSCGFHHKLRYRDFTSFFQ